MLDKGLCSGIRCTGNYLNITMENQSLGNITINSKRWKHNELEIRKSAVREIVKGRNKRDFKVWSQGFIFK